MENIELFLNKLFGDKRISRKILLQSQMVELDRGVNILKEAHYISSVPLVIQGRIKVTRHDDTGKEVLLYYIDPGESCALSIAAGLNHQKSVAFADTDVKTQMLSVPIGLIESLISQFPGMNDFVLKLFHNRFNELVQFIDSVVFKTMDFRLIELLKKKQKQTGMATLEITHQQLANELGTAREVVSRLLKQLENESRLINYRGKIKLLSTL
jgi:CRP/FNR family transcriptional regulator